jgi:hypothetical protein
MGNTYSENPDAAFDPRPATNLKLGLVPENEVE